jgi:hypothetical protein
VNKDQLIAELSAIDPTLAKRLQSRPPGRPKRKDAAIKAAVWVAVMNERYRRSYGKGKRGNSAPSVLHACQIIARRGGIKVTFRDGRVPFSLEKAETIRRWFNDATDSLDDEYVIARVLAWFEGMRRELLLRSAADGDAPLAWVETTKLR